MKLKIAVVVFLAVGLQAVDAPKFSELGKWRILNYYKSAVIANQQLAAAQAAVQQAQLSLNQSVEKYNNVVKEEVKASGMKEGTTAQVDVVKDEVTPVLPKPEEKKPEGSKK